MQGEDQSVPRWTESNYKHAVRVREMVAVAPPGLNSSFHVTRPSQKCSFIQISLVVVSVHIPSGHGQIRRRSVSCEVSYRSIPQWSSLFRWIMTLYARYQTATGSDIEIEERAESELKIVAGVKIAPDGIGAWNPAFDVTPGDLITAIVTDKGVIRPVSQGDGDTKKASYDVKAFVASQVCACMYVHVCVYVYAFSAWCIVSFFVFPR